VHPHNQRFFVALLLTKTDTVAEADNSAHRVCPVTVKLTQDELREVTKLAARSGQPRSEWIRELILAKLQSAPSKADPILAEIVGIRLILVNLLGPVASGQEPITSARLESILDDIKRIKHQVAGDIQRQNTGDSK
jgi:hypothetical protein